ncbi:hypothetical protein CFR73_03780 [Novacetimonas maltaceti]|uniref:Uncharacterized protein n=1 Tax=Novacetimonas maltaceti TaxID=1203393 RepID=A0A2S3W453_9PROT|nr:hypothetical protein [Novacetimonas maltaceti]POF63665.1 hypothetical protein KMAL_06310 [Novacetimonas maltaceti]PYD61203.1 hypothetical protein CFR73_03780 [Novacetimonas maltaceti]
MQPFATEFPVKHSENKAAFPAEVVAWIKGIRNSEVLTAASEREFDGENVYLVAGSGEELRMRALKHESDWVAIGFQHDMPDDQGRIWRTEAVLRRSKDDTDQDLIRFRTQCLAKRPGAFLETPKKPYLVKALLKDNWGGFDKDIEVCDEPLWLEDNGDDLALAKLILDGHATKWLPVVYVSATGRNRWRLTEDQINKLAYDLGGVAHVVVEPSRNFSIRLKDASDGRNVYNGALGIAMPHHGFIRKFFLGRQFGEVTDITEIVRSTATRLRGFMPSVGWDWTELQEHALRDQRTALRDAISQGEADQLFDDFTKQLSDLQEENRRLTEQLNSQAVIDITKEEQDSGIFRSIGKEIYPGEITDRLRLAAQTALSVAEANGIDDRTTAVWKKILNHVRRSPALDELLADIRRATKDPKRMADALTSLLQRHGYHAKSENKHIRLEPDEGYEGLQNLTLPKTPSDLRATMNQRKQIERTLGINKIPQNVDTES